MTDVELLDAQRYLAELDASYDEYITLIAFIVRLAAEEYALAEGIPAA